MTTTHCTQDDQNNQHINDQELACASDREWSSLHQDTPGIWRIRPAIGLEGPAILYQAGINPKNVWILVHVICRQIRLRHFCYSFDEAWQKAIICGLLPGDER